MFQQRRFRRAAGLLPIAVSAILLLVPAPATAMSRSGGGDLSQRLALLARPGVRSAPQAIQAARLGVARHGPGSLLRQGSRILAYVRFDRGAVAGLGSLRARGAKIVHTSRRYQSVTVAARPGDLRSLARAPRVAAVIEALAPVAAEACTAGSVVSEGVKQLKAGEEPEEARALFPVDGSGVTVGILSDSFDLATEAADGSGPVATKEADDVASEDLPGACGTTSPVQILDEEDESVAEEVPPADEGRAMAQIVHDIAPGADIAFASAFNGEDVFAANIGALASAGADLIVDDVFYYEEPFFQDGPVAVAAGEAVEGGAAYFSAAGNSNLFDAEGHEIGSWETSAYRDAESCPPEVSDLPGFKGSHCLDFAPAKSQVDRTFGIKVAAGEILTVDLQWDEPWQGVGTDLDAFLLDADGNLITGSAEDNVEFSQRPFEIVQWENGSSSERTVQLVVNRFSGGSPRLKFAILANGSNKWATEYPRSSGADVVGPTIFGHNGTASAISVGAIRFNALTEPEKYSSRGPVRHDFGPVTGTEAAAPLESPEILAKPDLVATDCGATTFFAGFTGVAWRFCGTSAAAPHATGVAALMLEAEAEAESPPSPAGIRLALQEGAAPVGEESEPCAVGAGLVDAVGALQALSSVEPFTPPECLPPTSEVLPEEARASGDWGSEAPPAPPPTATPVPEPAPSGLPAGSVRPRTFFRHRPPHLIRTRTLRAKAVFSFGSNQVGASFVCRIDSGLFRPCPQRLARRFSVGRHTLRVYAHDAAGNADLTPAVYRFRVKRVG